MKEGKKLRRRIGLAIKITIALGISFRIALFYLRPDGFYDAPEISEVGCYWEFHDGRIELVTSRWRDEVGRYFRQDGAWVWAVGTNEMGYLKSSLTGLQISESKSTRTLERIFFRPKFDSNRDE